MRKTKIVCTLGPATDREGVLRQMLEAGMNVARFNFSHGSHAEHKGRLDALKALRAELGLPVAAMLDTKGPEVRLKSFAAGSVMLRTGQEFTLTTDSHVIPMEGFLSQVAVLMKHRLTEETAYKCVTIRAAKALDLADELGSIEPGKAADVVIWESEPFKAGGRPRTVLINGKIQYQTEN